MKRSSLILFLLIISIYSISQAQDNNTPPLSLVWEMGANEIEPGCFENTFKIVNHSNGTIDIKGETPHSVFNGIQTLLAITGINDPFPKLYGILR